MFWAGVFIAGWMLNFDKFKVINAKVLNVYLDSWVILCVGVCVCCVYAFGI